jgi:DNA polymerase-3 subunit alpha
MKQYTSLHNHTDYSNLKLIDSINRVPDMLDYAYSLGLPGMAITDHDCLSGHIEAIKHYKKNYEDKDFKLILGNEVYVAKEGMAQDTYAKGDKFYHMVLLAKNKEGHRQLRQLSSRAWDRMFVRAIMRTPTFISDLDEIIGGNPGNVVGTTACLGGVTAAQFLKNGIGSLEYSQRFLEDMVDIFGVDNFYIELQPSYQEDQIRYNKFMIKHFWGKYNFIFSTDSHYKTLNDQPIHKAFLNSKDGNREVDAFYSATFIMDSELVWSYMKDYVSTTQFETMVDNTNKINDSVEIYDLAGDQVVPVVPMEILPGEVEESIQYFKDTDYEYIKKYTNSDEDANQFFFLQIMKGFKDLGIPFDEEYLTRLEEELAELWETSIRIGQPISNYFNTMQRMIDIIWEDADSLVGVSRGSAAGFLVNYALGITQLDPLRQDVEMPLWRFIHRDRPELPDIDIDTEGDKRTKVFNKVREYFQSIGGDVINVCTFGTEKTKSAMRTAARGLGLDDDVVSYMVSLVPNERGFDWTLKQCMFGEEDEDGVEIKKPIAAFVKEMNKYPNLWTVASSIEGLISRLGVHASGIIALNSELTEHNSLMKTSKGVPVSAYNLKDSEYLGGLKYDFLTINALDKIRTTLNLLLENYEIEWKDSLRKTYNHYLLPKNLLKDDDTMWSLAQDGKIVELFQFDTPVGAQAIKSVAPTTVGEMAIANSLMRLMKQEDAIEMPADTYVRFKNNMQHWYDEMRDYGLNLAEVEVLEKYLLPLSGVADSQESVMMIVMDPAITAFTVPESNKLRKAIAKKDPKVMEVVREHYYEKGQENGTRPGMLNYIWNVQIKRQLG